MKNDTKKIGYYIGLTIITGIILSIISARVKATFPQVNEFFDYQAFIIIIAGMILIILIKVIFPKIKKRSKL